MVLTKPKMTIPTQLVLEVLLTEPDRERYGAEIGAHAGLPSGTVHPILARLEGLGWLESQWENIDPAAVGRPTRRYYQLTGFGVTSARSALANTYRAKAALGAAGRPGQGRRLGPLPTAVSDEPASSLTPIRQRGKHRVRDLRAVR